MLDVAPFPLPFHFSCISLHISRFHLQMHNEQKSLRVCGGHSIPILKALAPHLIGPHFQLTLLAEESDHIIFEGIVAFVIAEFLPMTLIHCLKSGCPPLDLTAGSGPSKRINAAHDHPVNPPINGDSACIADRAWTQERQNQISTGADPPCFQGMVEVLALPSHSEAGCRVEQAAYPYGRVGQETAERHQGLFPFSLKYAVIKVPDLAEVGEKVADAGLGKAWYSRFVGADGRKEHKSVELVVKFVHVFIEAFPWIFSAGDDLVVAEFAHPVHGRDFWGDIR